MKKIVKEFARKFSAIHNDKPHKKHGSRLQRSEYRVEFERNFYLVTIERIGVK